MNSYVSFLYFTSKFNFKSILFTLLAVMLCLGNAKAQSTNIKVSGIVKDSSGIPLSGVGVTIKGSKVSGTLTDLRGKFSIIVPNEKSKLHFTSVGFLPKDEQLGGRTEIIITLIAGVSSLDEVVVVGYGTQKKRDVSGAIASVNSKQIGERQAVNLEDALQGQAAGVQISQESGRPGAESSVKIRGTATFEGGSDPLYIVDGAQGVNIDGINPSDIESVEILKDAASAAIYGARSANGVIIITTKKGRDGKAKVEFHQLTSFGRLAHKLPQSNRVERLFLDSIRLVLSKSTKVSTANDSLNPSINADNDYQDLLTRTGIRNQTDLTISGASGKTMNYFGSLGLTDDKGIIINSWSKIIRGRFNTEYKPSDKFSFGTKVQASYRTENRINDGNVLVGAIQRPAYFPLYFPDGTFVSRIGGTRNPLAEAFLAKNNFDIYDGALFNTMSYNFNKDLKFTVDANVTANYLHNLVYNPAILSQTSPGLDSLSVGTNLATYWQVEAFFNYNKKLTDKHSINSVIGISADQGYTNSNYLYGSSLVTEDIQTVNTINQNNLPIVGETRYFSNSAFARIGYSYLSKYILNATVRADGSSRFGPANRWGYFPSASFAWRLSDEKFMNWSKKYLDDAKVRISYGITGNDKIGAYDAITRYRVGGNFYNGVSGIAQQSTLGNDHLSWEQTSQVDIGTDLILLKGKLNVTIDYYNKVTDKLLYSAPLPGNTGYNSVKVNVGKIRNNGLELNIGGYPVRNKDWSWNVSCNMSFNTNKVLSLYNGTDLLPFVGTVNIWKVSQGGHIGDFYGYKALGVYAYDSSNAYTQDWTQLDYNNGAYLLNGKPYSGTIQKLTINGLPSRGGDMIWQNTNKDSVIDDHDRVVLGNAIPKWTAGLTNLINYKQFSFSFSIYISWGNQIYNYVRQTMNNNLTSNTTPTPDYIHGAWYYQGQITNFPAPINNGIGNGRDGNSIYLEDASFIRLRNIRLSYQLKKKTLSVLKLNNISVFAFGNNLLTFTNYKGYDPEISFPSALTPGMDTGRYPRKKELGVGFNVTF